MLIDKGLEVTLYAKSKIKEIQLWIHTGFVHVEVIICEDWFLRLFLQVLEVVREDRLLLLRRYRNILVLFRFTQEWFIILVGRWVDVTLTEMIQGQLSLSIIGNLFPLFLHPLSMNYEKLVYLFFLEVNSVADFFKGQRWIDDYVFDAVEIEVPSFFEGFSDKIWYFPQSEDLHDFLWRVLLFQVFLFWPALFGDFLPQFPHRGLAFLDLSQEGRCY